MSGTALASLHAARTLAAEEAATTDYTKFHLYITLMGVAAGVALVLLVRLGRSLLRREDPTLEGYAIAFGVQNRLITS